VWNSGSEISVTLL
jgi:hypothetical protein